MSWWSDITDNIGSFITGDDSANTLNKKADKALKEASNIKNKSVSELQQEGRMAAGQAAADKAGIAASQAKAATMQNGGNKLQAATNAAGEAASASKDGYDTASQNYTSMAQAQDQVEKNAERTALNNQASLYSNRANQKQAQKTALAQTAGNIISSFGKSSDKNKKSVKHTYIPADRRVNNGK